MLVRQKEAGKVVLLVARTAAGVAPADLDLGSNDGPSATMAVLGLEVVEILEKAVAVVGEVVSAVVGAQVVQTPFVVEKAVAAVVVATWAVRGVGNHRRASCS